MTPRAPKKGPLARFLEGLDVKTVGLLVTMLAGLGGVKWQGDQKVEQATAKVEQVEALERKARHAGGRLRATVDTLRWDLAAERKERRREVRALRVELERLRARPVAAPEPAPRPIGPGVDDEADGEEFGPEEAPAPTEAPKGGPVRKVWGWLKKLGG
jgi:hypothetical protein